jgi:hypothetical protein
VPRGEIADAPGIEADDAKVPALPSRLLRKNELDEIACLQWSGMVGGIGMVLLERTVLDPRGGRPVNAHMADHLMPVSLDIRQIEAHLVEEDDPHVNPLGVKGLGEVALIGMVPATPMPSSTRGESACATYQFA